MHRNLKITDRYVGSETGLRCDNIPITSAYGSSYRAIRSAFMKFPEKHMETRSSSASEVRKKYAENQLKSVCGMLPESTRRYLERKKNENRK